MAVAPGPAGRRSPRVRSQRPPRISGQKSRADVRGGNDTSLFRAASGVPEAASVHFISCASKKLIATWLQLAHRYSSACSWQLKSAVSAHAACRSQEPEGYVFALAVVLSILVLAAGTTLVAAGRASEARLVNLAVRAFTLVVAPTAVLIGIVPHLYEELGALGPALVAAGFALLWLAEHRRAPRRRHDGAGRPDPRAPLALRRRLSVARARERAGRRPRRCSPSRSSLTASRRASSSATRSCPEWASEALGQPSSCLRRRRSPAQCLVVKPSATWVARWSAGSWQRAWGSSCVRCCTDTRRPALRTVPRCRRPRARRLATVWAKPASAP